MNESQIKTIYLNWKLEYQDKILPADTLWPFSDNGLRNSTSGNLHQFHIFNTNNFIKEKYVKLHKIGDTAYCKMLNLLDYCTPIIDKPIKDFFNLDCYNRYNCGFISFLNDMRQYMTLELFDMTLINDKFYIKSIGERIEFFPVYVDHYSIKPEIRIIPSMILLFTSNLSSLFIKHNKISYNKNAYDMFYFMNHVRIF